MAARKDYAEIEDKVDKFAGLMKFVLKSQRNMAKQHWRTCTREHLEKRLGEEVLEMVDAHTPDEIRQEAADVANFCMFIWDRAEIDADRSLDMSNDANC